MMTDFHGALLRLGGKLIIAATFLATGRSLRSPASAGCIG